MINKIVYRQEDKALVIEPIEGDAVVNFSIDFEALKVFFLTHVDSIKYIVIEGGNIHIEPNQGEVVTLITSNLIDSKLFDAFIIECELLIND
jgi:hypothetical protein